MEEYERLSVQSRSANKGERGPRGRRKVADETHAHVKIDLVLEDADRSPSDGRSVRSECALDDDGSADSAPFTCQGRVQ
jgi:hypothetical protein